VRPRRLFLALAAILLATGFFAPRQLLAQQADVIRGRVTGPDSLAVEGVTVTATSISGGVNRTTRTDKNGRFTITFPNGDGDYMVSFAALGFAAKRFEVKRTADEEILVADTKLQRAAVNLEAMKVQAPREKVARNDRQPDIGGSERPVDNAGLPAASLGDLAAMAATLPGVQLVPGENGDPNGFSVLGLGSDQNNTTLNGMNFGGNNLPRDAAVSSSLATSPYDVSRGGFSGAQLNLRTRGGNNFITRGSSFNIDAPQMQWTDRAAQSLGQQYTNLSLGGLVSGPITLDKAFYSVSYQLGRRSNDLQSLLNTDPLGLQTAGVAADSVSRFLGILRQASVPTTIGTRFPRDRVSDQGSLLGSFDFAPPSSTSGQALNLTLSGSWNKTNPASPLTTAVPSTSGDRVNWNGGAMARHNTYFGFGVLSETSVGLSESRNYATPYLWMPGGRVRVNSTFDDGTSGVQMLSFGGSQAMSTSQTTTSVAFQNQMSWFSANNRHRLRLTSELRRDGYSSDQSTNLLGTFTYNSLADLDANAPSSFTRQLTPRRSSASQMVGALSLGDAFRSSPNIQIQYGVRVDANHFFATPTHNADLEQTFGLNNEHVPSRLYVSPRLGFSWQYGEAPQIAGFAGAVRGPRAVVRGGLGMFQNTPSTTLISQALDNTGLPSAVQYLNCVGPATPTPDWNAYANNLNAVPTACADGTNGTVFANTSPNVALFDPKYSAPRSLRSNLQWNGPILGNRFTASIDGTYSLNLDQPGFVNLNFNPATRFSLDNEDGRPVFVQPTSIVPATGAIASGDARVSQNYARVTELRSDMRSESRQATLRLNPSSFSTNFTWGLSYVYSQVRERTRGFASTVGNPLDVAWSRSSFDSRHQLVYNLGYNFLDAIRVSWYGQFRSGTPFTPTIASDVNGDGFANDRAFVFNPASADPAVAAGMQELLTHGSKAARDCLSSQLGHLAERNSCQGPWTTTANLSITFNPVKVRMPQRASLSFNLSNPLGAADMMLHGENNLRGWGQQPLPDAALLYVRGFDAQSRRFRYEVNERFGATNPQTNPFRTPVTLTAMLRFDVGPTRERQMLSMQLDRGRTTEGTKVQENMLRLMYGTGGVPNPMATILRQQDSLHLTSKQADSLAMLNRIYSIKVDSIWSPVAKYLAELPDHYDQGEAYDRYLTARRASIDYLAVLAPDVKGLLTPEQRRKLPGFISGYLEPRYLASIRSGTSSFTGGGIPGMGALPAGAAVDVIRAAGSAGGGTVIVRTSP
jgi:carboxypeptidase family protein